MDGKIIDTGERKLVADKIKLVREVPTSKIESYFAQNWDSLKNDADCKVRCAVAEQGYGFEILNRGR